MKTFGSWLLEDLAQRGVSQPVIESACGITSDQLARIMSEESPFNLPVEVVFEEPESLLPSVKQVIDLFKSYATSPDPIQEGTS